MGAIGDDVQVITKRKALIAVFALIFSLSACGDPGESPEDKDAVVQMLERLGHGRAVAECMAKEFDGKYKEADLQPLIDARGDFTTVDFDLVEDLVNARTACTSDS